MKRNSVTLITLLIFIFSLQPFKPAAQLMKSTTTDSVVFIGIENDHLVFEVHFRNTFQKGSTLSIFDEDGREVYTESIRSNVGFRRYRIDKNLATKLQFHIKSKKVINNTSFNVDLKMEEKWQITKV